MRKATKLGILVLTIVATMGLVASPAVAQEPTQSNTVTVEARRVVDVEPDLGIVSLGVRVKAATAEAATDKLTNRTRSVLNALRSGGFTNDELSTVDVDLDRVCLRNCRDRNPDDKFRPTPVYGYRGSAGVRLETSRLNRLGAAIDIGIDAGATSIRGVRFDVDDKAAAVNEALRQAMVVAVDKARILAETGGRELGPAIIITEGRTQAPYAFDVEASRLMAFADAAGTASGGGSGGGSNPFPIEPPTLSASARIVVTFELL